MHRQKTARAHLPTAGNRRTRYASARQQTEGSLMAGTNTIKQQTAEAGAAGAGQVKAALQVFAGGACYGAMATTYKLAYAAGFTSAQVVASQAWFGCLFFALATLAGHALGHRWQRVGRKLALKLMGLGALTCLTSILYCYAMSVLPAPVALTLLFQFTWLGLVWQTVMTRRPPRLLQVASALVIVFGTVFASGVYKTGITGYDPVALLCALGAAVSCSLFVTLSGRVEAPCSSEQRGVIVCAGSVIMSLTVCPDYIVSGVLARASCPLPSSPASLACYARSCSSAWALRTCPQASPLSWPPRNSPPACSSP